MLALLSSSRATASDRFVRLKYVIDCLTLSS